MVSFKRNDLDWPSTLASPPSLPFMGQSLAFSQSSEFYVLSLAFLSSTSPWSSASPLHHNSSSPSFKTLLNASSSTKRFFLCPPVFLLLGSTPKAVFLRPSQEMTSYSSLQLHFVPPPLSPSRRFSSSNEPPSLHFKITAWCLYYLGPSACLLPSS